MASWNHYKLAVMERGSEVQTSEGKAKAGVGARVGAAFGALLLASLAAVAVIAMADIGSLTPCEDIGSDASLLSADGECFEPARPARP